MLPWAVPSGQWLGGPSHKWLREGTAWTTTVMALLVYIQRCAVVSQVYCVEQVTVGWGCSQLEPPMCFWSLGVCRTQREFTAGWGCAQLEGQSWCASCLLPPLLLPSVAGIHCNMYSQHFTKKQNNKKDSKKVTTQTVLTCSLQTEYFINPITGNYSVNSHIKST